MKNRPGDLPKPSSRVSLYPLPVVLEEGHLSVPLDGDRTSQQPQTASAVSCNLWFQVSGNPNGVPVVLFHGGPGYYTCVEDVRLWNPALFKVIAFDQRGSGKSSPPAHVGPVGLYQNITIDMIVDDAEALRRRLLGPKAKWIVCGYSWGSAVAVAYASRYGGNVQGVLVQGVYTGHVAEHRGLFATRKGHEEALALFLDCLSGLLGQACLDWQVLADDPLRLHELVRDSVLEKGLDNEGVQRALAAWSQFENYYTYPESHEYFLTKLRLAADTSTSPYRSSHKDVTGALMQLFLFPKMMRSDGSPKMLSGSRVPTSVPFVVVQGDKDEICDASAALQLFEEVKASRRDGKSKSANARAPLRYLSCKASHDVLDDGPMQRSFIEATSVMFDMVMASD